jgi:protein-tyrosine phosphatase
MSSISVNSRDNLSISPLGTNQTKEKLITKVSEVAKEIFSEAVYWGKCALGALVVITLVKAVLLYPITAIALVILGGTLYKHRHDTASAVKLHFSMLKNTLKIEPWFKEIKERHVILGKVPLQNKDHGEQLRKMGVKTVVALVEEKELDKKPLLAHPVTSSNWQEKGIGFTKIIIKRSEPVSIETLDKTVAVMEATKNKGEKSYVYCNSNGSISAMITAAYLMKSHRIPLQEARELIEKQKPTIKFNLQELGRLVEYDGHIRNQKK